LDYPSFTIEFPEHLLPEDWRYCLDQLRNTGASVETQTDRVFLGSCARPPELAHVVRLLFHIHFRNLCRVLSASGGAEARASAYQKPPSS
jgi:hypothetical protein